MISDRQLGAIAAIDRRVRRFPPDASCADCGERSPLVLVTTTVPTVCYRCCLRRAGRPFDKDHHVGGRGSPIVADVRFNPNLHRACSWLQFVTWQALEIPSASPLAVGIDFGALAVLREIVV